MRSRTRQGKTSQIQDKTRQDMTRRRAQDKTRRDKTRQVKTRQNKTFSKNKKKGEGFALVRIKLNAFVCRYKGGGKGCGW